MRIVRFEAENVKRLKAVAITPNGSVVQITGPNGSGKSSVLDAIFYAIAGTANIPAQPIREGEASARVMLDLGEVVVTRSWKADGPKGGTLTVATAEGAKFPSPQTMLDRLFDGLGFDPLAFTRMKPADQGAELRRLVKLDVDVDALDAANVVDFAKRRDLNAALRAADAQVDAAANALSGLEKPARVDDGALLSAMQTAAEDNGKRADERRRRGADQRSAEVAQEAARDLRDQAAALMLKANQEDERAASILGALALLPAIDPDVDLATLRDQITAAKSSNQVVDSFDRLDDLKAKRDQFKAASDALTEAMDARKAERDAAMMRATMPVPGLGFNADGVTMNDLPFDQASSAEQIRVSVAIAMAANPKLRVLRIKDGSLLDDKSLAIVAEMADANDYQVWVEMVRESGANVGVVLEEGEVVSASPAETSEPAA